MNAQYEDLLRDIYTTGTDREDRTGVGTRSKFGCRMEFDVHNGLWFPLITTKKVYFKGVVHELLWFLKGDTNVKWLQDRGVHIWDEWADENGDLGPIYGKQWRDWNGVDQISNLIDGIKNDPYSRRLIVNAWNVGELDEMALPPCHMMCQFYADPKSRELSCQLYQRSADMFLGVPFNIAEYALLLMMVAQQTGYIAKRFVWVGGDCHIYRNHFDQVEEQLDREPYEFPILTIGKIPEDIFSYKYEDFRLSEYRCHPAIKAPVAV